jgi:hypothetical protein
MTRLFTLANKENFRNELRNMGWHSVLTETNVNLALKSFLDIFLTLFDLQKINKNNVKIKDFMTKGLLISRIRKNLLFKKQLMSPTPNNVLAYREYRNIYNSVLCKSKKMYYECMINKFKSKPKKLWEILNCATGKAANNNSIREIFTGIHYTNNPKEMAQSFNDHFSKIGPEISSSIEPSNIDPISFMPVNPDLPDFIINNTGPCHVIDVVKAMHSKNSVDCNNVSLSLIKFVLYEICVPLAHIFKLSIETGIFPDAFKTSRVVPIYKNGDPRICDNYRPIALVDCLLL